MAACVSPQLLRSWGLSLTPVGFSDVGGAGVRVSRGNSSTKSVTGVRCALTVALKIGRAGVAKWQTHRT
ncbi:hypothetical protein SBV1_270051 [Verrucomicrobia bacterium]|nr:hypothetical protein SBV1_270051 [Verrucomicrobiota bacterium]